MSKGFGWDEMVSKRAQDGTAQGKGQEKRRRKERKGGILTVL
jgi:hypothetical protein